MKKKASYSNKRTGVKQSRSNRKALRRSRKVEVVYRNPGPSSFITKGEDGKVAITNIVGNIKQKDYTTEVAKAARQANKNAKQSKKERIKQILASAGFEPTVHYSRSEKKKFTRLVKKHLFVQPKPVTLTDDEIKVRIEERKQKRAKLFEERRYMSPFGQKKVQNAPTAAELSVKESKDLRQFKYVVQNKSDANPQADTDFLTDYFEAETREEANKLAIKIANNFKDSDKFTGIRLQDSKDNSIIFYPKSTLLAA